MEKEFNEKDEKNLKGISKAIWIIAKICRIFMMIGVVCIGLVMLILPAFISKIEINDNTIRIEGVEEVIKLEDIKPDNKDAKIVVSKISDVFNNNSRVTITLFAELAIAIIVVDLIIYIIIFKYLEKIFKNIDNEDTPFTFENSENLRKVAWLLVASIGVGVIINIVINLLLRTDSGLNISLVGVIEALFVFSMAYVFKYGATIKETKALKKGKKDE